MSGVWWLSWQHLRHHRGPTLILVLCFAVSLFLPVSTAVLIDRYEAELVARSGATPMVAGARGSRVDLTLSTLYFRPQQADPVPARLVDELSAPDVLAIPLHVGFTARGRALVGTAPEYFELRGLTPSAGTRPLRLGDVALGARAARDLDLGPGDTLFSDQKELYDITVPPAIGLAVVGVLAPTGTADDDAVFTDVRTAWVVAGLLHGHVDADAADADKLLGRTEAAVFFSGALVTHQSVSLENIASFHGHGAPEDLPLTAIIVVPRSDKAGTMVKSRLNTSPVHQMIVPRAVIGELLAEVFRLRAVLDGYATALGVSTLLLTALILVLSTRLRAGEMATLNHIGASRRTAGRLLGTEMVIVLALALVLAGLGVVATVAALGEVGAVL